MTKHECKALIDELRRQVNDKGDRMRKKIIGLAVHEMGWTMESLERFCRERSTYKKGLNAHTVQELPHLINQIEQIHAKTNV